MDPATLRGIILSGDNQLMNSPAWRFMSPQQKRLFLATRAFWSRENSDVTTSALHDLCVLYNEQNPDGEKKQ